MKSNAKVEIHPCFYFICENCARRHYVCPVIRSADEIPDDMKEKMGFEKAEFPTHAKAMELPKLHCPDCNLDFDIDMGEDGEHYEVWNDDNN